MTSLKTFTPHAIGQGRRGATLMIFAIALPVLLGVVGLVIDSGLMMAAQRQTRTAADAAAMAATHDLMRGRSLTVATATATTFVQQYNGLTQATVTVRNPPTTGPYAGESRYVEVSVSNPVSTWFIQILGGERSRTVTGRAVAGYEPVASGPKIVALNPGARPGLSISGGGSLVVDGGVAINSEGGGVDENGQPVNNGNNGVAASVANNSTFRARTIQSVGGVNNPGNFRQFDSGVSGSPLRTKTVTHPDPYLNVPPPTTANGATATEWPAVNVTGNQTVTLYPGVYPSINIGSGDVTFMPGIYIIRGGTLRITDHRVRANGVMFYLTGNDYNVNTGLPDLNDQNRPPGTTNATFSSATINAGLNFSGYSDPNSPFNGLMFYQRRWNTQAFNIQGNSAAGNLAGAIYAKWASIKVAGQGTYDAQFVVGSFETTGNGTVTIRDAASLVATANLVFLVE
jgi:Flp pilus assembly protein TadG